MATNPKQTQDQGREIEIDIQKIFYMIRPKLVYVLIITILGAVITAGFTHFFITPQYTATVKMYVYSNTDRVSSDSSISSSELEASQELVNTYIYVLESNTVLEKVAEDLDLDLSPGQIRSMVQSAQITKTEAFQVSVSSTDPELSARIANSIAKVCPDEIVRVIKAGGVEIIDYADVPSNPSSPDLKKNTVIGAGVAFLLSLAFFFFQEVFNTSITTIQDIEGYFDVPVLGTIPELEIPEKEGQGDNKASKKSKKGGK